MKTNSYFNIPTNFILWIGLFILVASCSSRVGSAYYEEFYKNRQDQFIHLIDGERAPLEAEDLKYITHYPYDEAYRVIARFDEAEKKDIFKMSTYSGKTKEFAKIGTLTFKLNGTQDEIHVYQNVRYATHPEYGKYYFVPFKDLTSGEESYGGGRYMDMDKALFSSSKVLLDFNQAYNPWCAYSDGYNCPIPPAENDLDVAIKAGEKLFEKDKTH